MNTDLGFADILDENISARKEWDFHAGYLWTFFPESDKEKVAHWLQGEGVRGLSNADIGGGWYVSVPESIVIDMSPVSLEKNPSREKILFDLDTIGPGNKLPLRDGSLETVTMTSVWQYLNKPEALLEDLKRVLVPGGKAYIINQDGAGLSEHKKQCSHGEGIMWQIHGFGYDVELIQIPIGKSSELHHWYAVKVSMPLSQYELFPEIREYSIGINKLLAGESDTDFYQENQSREYAEARLVLAKSYAQAEFTRTQYLEVMLHIYPITQASIELVQRAEQEAQALSQKENAPVLLWLSMPKIVLDIYQEGDISGIEMCTYTSVRVTGKSISWSGGGSVCGVYTWGHPISHFLMDIENNTLLHKIDKKIVRELLTFIQYHALNDFTREKQKIVRDFLRMDYQAFIDERDKYKEKFLQNYNKDEMYVMKRELRVAEYENIFLSVKQRRKAELFLTRKREIEKGNISALGTGTLSPLTEREKQDFFERIVSTRY